MEIEMFAYRSMTVTIGAMRIEALVAEAASAPSLRPILAALQLLTKSAFVVLGRGEEAGAAAGLDVGMVDGVV
jgi:hypothetical protein